MENRAEYEKVIPRPYLSWTQYQIWKKDPNLYYQIYWEGLDQARTKYLELGKRLSEALERGESKDPMMQYLCAMLPGYKFREYKIDVVFEGVPLQGKLDTFEDEPILHLREYKSGKKWTESMARNHGQLKWYALLVYLKFGKLPEEVWLDWAKTEEDNEGNLEFTGDIKSWLVPVRMKDIIEIGHDAKKVWAEIQEMWKSILQDQKNYNGKTTY